MEKCVRCGAETILHVSGVPVCVDCDNKNTNAQASRLNQELRQPLKPASNDDRLKSSVVGG
jgi:hypothetical protein